MEVLIHSLKSQRKTKGKRITLPCFTFTYISSISTALHSQLRCLTFHLSHLFPLHAVHWVVCTAHGRREYTSQRRVFVSYCHEDIALQLSSIMHYLWCQKPQAAKHLPGSSKQGPGRRLHQNEHTNSHTHTYVCVWESLKRQEKTFCNLYPHLNVATTRGRFFPVRREWQTGVLFLSIYIWKLPKL